MSDRIRSHEQFLDETHSTQVTPSYAEEDAGRMPKAPSPSSSRVRDYQTNVVSVADSEEQDQIYNHTVKEEFFCDVPRKSHYISPHWY